MTASPAGLAVMVTVKESMQGVQLSLDPIDAKGGIGVEKIQPIAMDDGFDVKKAEANGKFRR